jgi:arsenate reductase
MKKLRILFLCTGNSCRSQMAEAIVNHEHANRAIAFSCGTNPRAVHPLAIRVMQEIGIDISHQKSKTTDTFTGEKFDLFITLCNRANEHCPLNFEGQKRLHAGFSDPAEKQGSDEVVLAEFRVVRDAIQMWLGDYFDVTEEEL